MEIDLQIEAASISTGDEKRDAHLLGIEYFDIKSRHQISFIVSEMGNADDSGKYQLWGEI